MNGAFSIDHLKALPHPSKLDSFYPALGHLECGLLDGGCLAFARAAQTVLGGELWVAINGYDRPDHFVLRLADDQYLDGDGVSTGKKVLTCLVEQEFAHGPMQLRAATDADWMNGGEIPPGDDLQPALQASVREWLAQKPTIKRSRKTSASPQPGDEAIAMHALRRPLVDPAKALRQDGPTVA